MSEAHGFIEEVTEAVRRDRLFRLFRRYGWIAILLVVVLVGGTAWTEWRDAQGRAEAQARGDAILAAMQAETPAARVEALGALDAAGSDAPVVALLRAGAVLEAGDREAAADALAGVASNADAPRALRDLARLKRVRLAAGGQSREQRLATLAELASPGAPYRLLALETQAELHAGAGETEAAIESLKRVLEAPDATPGLRRRARQLMVALGGTPGAS